VAEAFREMAAARAHDEHGPDGNTAD